MKEASKSSYLTPVDSKRKYGMVFLLPVTKCYYPLYMNIFYQIIKGIAVQHNDINKSTIGTS